MTRFHFVAGLPGSGASVLSALLAQNPRFVARGSSPACTLLDQSVQMFDEGNPLTGQLHDSQKIALWRGVLDAIYHDRPIDSVVFDGNRNWLHYTDLLVRLFPLSRFILCVRNPAFIANALEAEHRHSSEGDRQARLENLLADTGLLGANIALLRQALSGQDTERMIVIDYDRLVDDPEEVMDVLYDFLREPEFAHDYQNLSLVVPQLDPHDSAKARVIEGPVQRSNTETVLTARTVQRLSGRAFWRNLRRTNATMMLGRSH